ncbi:MAG: EAL domain-containing protein [Pseudomonadota bacterium]
MLVVMMMTSPLYLTAGLILFVLAGAVVFYVTWLRSRLQQLAWRNQSILGSVAEGVVGLDREGRVIFVNPAVIQLLGYGEADLVGKNFHALVQRDAHGQRVETPAEALLADSSVLQGEAFYVGNKGRLHRVEYTLANARDNSSGDYAVLTFRDITESQKSEIRLQEAIALFKNSSDAILICDKDNRVQWVNQAFTAITGYSLDEVMRKDPKFLSSGHHDPSFYAAMWRGLEKDHWAGEIWNRRKSGTLYLEWLSITVLREKRGDIAGFIAQFSEIASRRQVETEIRYRGNYDELTGLPNRHLLVERLDMALGEARRYEQRTGLLFVNLDRFKAVNDALGYRVGDQALQEVAKRLAGCIRETDTLARQYGDEFTVVLHRIESYTAADRLAEKIFNVLAEPFRNGTQTAQLGASIGIAIAPEDGTDVFALLKNADMALFRAKAQGRNHCQFYDPTLTAAALAHRVLAAELRATIENRQLTVHYQPILVLQDGRLIGAEALLRGWLPSQGWVAPEVLVHLAEEIGLIDALGGWMLDTVCEQLAAWKALGWDGFVTINVLGRQIADALSLETLQRTLAKHGLAARDMGLEVTEGLLLTDAKRACRWLEEIRGFGIQVSLDNFGTGYASLYYLRQMNPDRLKIDKSFMSELARSSPDQALVRAAIAAGQSLGMTVIAEGVEDADTLDFLKSLGCDQAQGNYFCPALPAGDFFALVQSHGGQWPVR